MTDNRDADEDDDWLDDDEDDDDDADDDLDEPCELCGFVRCECPDEDEDEDEDDELSTSRNLLRGFPMTLRISCLALALMTALGTANAQLQRPTTVGPLKPGQVRIVASYLNANGRLVVDTLLLTVSPAVVATVDLLNAFNPPRWISNVTVGKPFCAYAVARDSAGNILTGRVVTFTSLDTLIARITPSGVCPDTTIDPSKIPANPIPPGGMGR